MVDTVINSALFTSFPGMQQGRFTCFANQDLGYTLVIDSSLDVVYHKFASGIWGAAQPVGAGVILQVGVWYDRWTRNIETTKLLITWNDSTSDDAKFNALNVFDETLDGETIPFAAVSVQASASIDVHDAMVVRAEGGNVYVWSDVDGGTEISFARSENDGATWTARNTGLFEVSTDRVLLVPGALADLNDIHALYYDKTAGELTLKTYDNSGDSWSESAAILSGLGTVLGINDSPLSAMQRHSDGHIIAVVATESDSATGDLKVVDITDGTTFSTLTDVITDTDDWYWPRIFIDQATDDLYVTYLGKDDGSEVLNSAVKCYYQKSTDGGLTWGGEVAMSFDAADNLRGLASGGSAAADVGGRFMPTWVNEDLDDLFSNLDNAIVLAAAGPPPSPPGRAGKNLPPGWGGPAPPPRGTGPGPDSPSGAPPGTAPGYGKTHPQVRARQIADAVCLDATVNPQRHQSIAFSLVQLLHCLQGRGVPHAPQDVDHSLELIFLELGVTRPRKVTLAQELDIIAAHLP